ncbi:DMT family transporter [Zophobihabitans entericus]|uniref:DMT family transporter n=1 Tax=Zophobihabitans entericus TaxID=1635327 RepID=A0A6G9IAH0_9GAMM|nr:DMT family transporter [Zophobihabitans entericus]QIQ21213.1 DMT family transporter [Zophobihabitans entericus]
MTYLLLTLAAIFWGGNYVVGHILVDQTDPIILTEGRWALTALLLMCMYYKQVKIDLPKIKKSLSTVTMLAVFGQVLFPLTLYIGLQYTSSLNAAIYMSATPGMVLLINKLVFNDYISRNNILGVILSSLGVVYLILQGNFTNLDAFKNLNQGDLWTMGSAISWAFYCSFLRKKDKTISGNAFVTVSSLIGALILLPVTIIYSIYHPTSNFSPYFQFAFIAGLLYLVIFPSWLSYVFWNRGIADIGATRGEIYTHIIPLSGGLLSIIFLNVELAWFHLVSSLFIVAGIYLCSRK